MALTIMDLRDNMERSLVKANNEAVKRLGIEPVEVVGIRHKLPKPEHPLETRRHIGDTPRSSRCVCAVANPPSASAHSSAAACVLRRSTARTSRSDPLSKSQKVAAMQAKLERSRKRRVAAEKRVTDLRRQLEVLSTGYNVYGRMKRDETKLSTARKRELNEIKWLNHALGLEHERRRVLAHAEADKAAFMASLKK